ncbi:hypothetical protein ACKVV7_011430 [Pyricularia oryzae]
MPVNKGFTPNIIGIYGLPGAGKTTLLSQLRTIAETSPVHCDFYDGSTVIDSVVDGGLDAFKKMPPTEKQRHRDIAIRYIGNEARRNNKVTLVASHFMLPNGGSDSDLGVPEEVYTEADLDTFTHVVYLKVSPEILYNQRAADRNRKRALKPQTELRSWQDAEVQRLFGLCIDRGIIFATVAGGQESTVQRVAQLVSSWNVSEEQNLDLALSAVDDKVCSAQLERCRNILIFDADRTLAPQDSGNMFVQQALNNVALESDINGKMAVVLKKVYSGPLGYTHRAFQQVSALLENLSEFNDDYSSISSTVASQITVYPEMIALLSQAVQDPRSLPVVVTSGVRQVWEIVLQQMKLQQVPVFGGGRFSDQYVVTPQIKARIAERLATRNILIGRRTVMVYGDSPLDIPMMAMAERAFVVVGDEEVRSTTMDSELEQAISSRVFRKSKDKQFNTCIAQVLVPSTVRSRPNLPIAELQYPVATSEVPVYIADSTPAKLLASPMRDASIVGPALQEAHVQVGKYLATDLITKVLDLEDYTIPHVQGTNTIGYRLKAENRTLIVAMMRGGEPMARGVYQTFPQAIFAFAKDPHQVTGRDVADVANILLVDSVINTGKSMVDFVEHIRGMNPRAKILLVAGVVQAGAMAIDKEESLRRKMESWGDVGIVALRVSENQYTGVKGTDTGNRLFNTTHWD